MKFTPRLELAIQKATLAHAKQKRKGGNIPYIIHPFSVMCIASETTDDEDILIACLFHDILEDVPEEYPRQTMRAEFGDRVVDIVDGVTKDSSLKEWKARSKAYLDHLEHQASNESVLVSCADKIHNLMSILTDYKTHGNELWNRFSTKSGADQLWWYRSILSVVKKRKAPKVLIDQLDELVISLKEIVD